MRSGTTEKQTQGSFSNTSVNEEVDIFNRAILNVLSNFIPNEIVVCDEKGPPWFNNRLKTLIQEKMLHITFIAKTKIMLI